MTTTEGNAREDDGLNKRQRAAKLFVEAQTKFALEQAQSSKTREGDGVSTTSCPVPGGGSVEASRGECQACQAKGMSSANNMPKIRNDSGSNASSSESPLSSHRQVSSIPIGPSDLPNHQDKGETKWKYPSPQMFYNAMRRKGWQPKEDDMEVVVAIHNTVNERVWSHILSWEELLHASECSEPKLCKFQGRPKDYSPRARILNWCGYKLPFDRHDWVVDRCGKQVRYVIDFYNAAPSGPEPVAMHLDVR